MSHAGSRRVTRREFQTVGPATKDRRPSLLSLWPATASWWRLTERSDDWQRQRPVCGSLRGTVTDRAQCDCLKPAFTSHQLVVPSYRLSSYGRRAFSVAGPTTWNSNWSCLHRHRLWTITSALCFQSTNVHITLGPFDVNALYKLVFYLLTCTY